jgi:hypothetical protein
MGHRPLASRFEIQKLINPANQVVSFYIVKSKFEKSQLWKSDFRRKIKYFGGLYFKVIISQTFSWECPLNLTLPNNVLSTRCMCKYEYKISKQTSYVFLFQNLLQNNENLNRYNYCMLLIVWVWARAGPDSNSSRSKLGLKKRLASF